MIRIDQLSKSFGTKPILKSVTYHFPEGEKLALVGPNGAGKTTLLDILTGEQDCDDGHILKPARLRLGYLPQEPNQNPEESCIDEVLHGGQGFMQTLYKRHHDALTKMTEDYSERNHEIFEIVDREFKSEDGYALEANSRAVLKGLGFSDEMILMNPKSLSGGWRMRLELAKIFVSKPNFLILDEPTNHLDLPSLAWVERWLISYQGTLLFVSHDRSLLERLPTMTLNLQQGKLDPYKGNFSAFLEERALRNEMAAATADSLKRQREHLQSFVDRFGAKASKARQAQSRVKMISRIKDLEGTITTEEDAATMALSIKCSSKSGRDVLKISNLSIGYTTPLSKNLSFFIERGQKVAIIGANGIGKSTLLKTLAGQLPQLDGTFTLGYGVTMGWFAQDQLDTLRPNESVMANTLADAPATSDAEARSLLGALLFRGSDVFKNVGVLSGGEKARVGLARLLTRQANFLLLDEPTNHLDLSSNAILTDALQEYEGTMLFVSHDREFIDAICTHVLVMLPDGRSQIFIGKLQDYQRLARQTGFPDVLDPEIQSMESRGLAKEKSTQRSQQPSQARLGSAPADLQSMKKELNRSQKRLVELETMIESHQNFIREATVQMELLQNDFTKIASLEADRLDRQNKLDAAEEEWLAVSSQIESFKENLQKS